MHLHLYLISRIKEDSTQNHNTHGGAFILEKLGGGGELSYLCDKHDTQLHCDGASARNSRHLRDMGESTRISFPPWQENY